MVAAATPMYIRQPEQDKLLQFCKSTQLSVFNPQNIDLRTRFKYIDQEYIRENNMANDQQTQNAQQNRAGNKRKIQDIVIPIVEPQVESSLAFLTSVFLTGEPLFGVVGDLNNMSAAKQMEAIVSNQSTEGGWARHLQMFFHDGLKYNFCAIEADWCIEKTYSLVTDATKGPQGQPKEVQWAGNKLKRLDPYNTFFDPRIKITEQHEKAEFAGYVELHNRVSLANYLQSLPFRMNVTDAYNSTLQLMGGLTQLYYIPEVFTENLSPASKMLGVVNWDLWANGGKLDTKMQYKNLYQLVTRYLRIVPRDFGLNVPAAGQVQLWKVVTVNDAVVVYAERLSNAHNFIPIIFGQPMEDGLNLQTKSVAQKQIPLQDIASALANSRLAARRRSVTDRGLYDPSRVDEKHINSDSPTAKIPVRPSAYGQDMSKAYYAIPFKDEQTQSIMQDVREVMSYSDLVSGQNRAQQGQFVKGNKTKSEYDDVQNKSSGRQRTMAIRLEHQAMMPLKKIIKFNILQYQPSGEVFSYVDQAPVNINPIDLRKTAVNFKISDGLDPAEKIMDGDTLQIALQAVLQSPELNQEYDAGAIFGELMSVKSNFDMAQFKRTQDQIDARNKQQIALEQAKRTPVQPGQQGQPPNGNSV
jgi:hypothetical protein